MNNTEKLSKLWLLLVVLGLLLVAPGQVVGTEFQFVRLLPTDDAFVDNNNPDTNYGTSTDLYVGAKNSEGHGTCRSYLKFDLTGLPAGATVVNAELLLCLHECYPSYQKRTICSHYVSNDSWYEGAPTPITWNNAPTYNPGSTACVTSTFSSPNTYYAWNVTADVIMAMGDNGVYSTAMVMQGEPLFYWNNFYSKEWTLMPDKRPYLQITYKLPGQVITSGSEGYNPEAGSTIIFGPPGLPTIPADFFGPGSDPFDGIIALKGSGGGGGGGRTVVNRTEGVYIPDSSPSATVATEMISLGLRSIEPINATFFGGTIDSFFDVYVTLETPSSGDMLISTTGGGGGGGVFSYQNRTLQLLRFEFVDVGDPMNTKELLVPSGSPYDDPVIMEPSNEAAWQTQPTKEAEVLGYDGFYPSGEQVLHSELMYAGAPTGWLDFSTLQLRPAEFCITTEEQWNEALIDQRVRAATVEELEDFRAQYNANVEEGELYPESAEFMQAELYVCGPESCGGEGYPCDERDAGLVMYWGEGMPDGEYAAAWVYTPPVDPDLSNCTLTTTVYPPCGMLVVSIGLQDAAGNIRGWFWNVAAAGAVPPFPPGTIACSPSPGPGPGAIPTNITIDLSQTGVAAATPAAASYSSAAAFDITQVIDYKFDEDNAWVASTPTQPPGSGLFASWNYWKNIVVAKKTPPPPPENKTKFYIKWSQPPVLIGDSDPKMIRGWDERSNYYWRPIVADDWLCEDDRPVTDFHWWGSFLGWNQPYPPPIAPRAFHIGIWMDMPVGADPDADFSHPWVLIWENFCDDWAWEFYGYDLDPRMGEADPCAPFEPEETCFQFEQFLSEEEWFYQDPNFPWPWGDSPPDPYPNGTVYWLSISAIYDPNISYIPHPWGWKTRQPHWNDDAVRIWDAEPPLFDYPVGYLPKNWPPVRGHSYKQGDPIWWPTPVDSWDMCFELTTKTPAYEDDPIPGDLNRDRIVNFVDLSVFAANWLTSSP